VEQLNVRATGLYPDSQPRGVQRLPIIFRKSYFRGATLAILALSFYLPASCAGGSAKGQPAVGNRMEAGAVTAEMDRLFDMILQKYSDDAVFIAKLQAAQVAWCRFRDARIEALYPAEDKALTYGSAYSHCRQSAIVAMTLPRIEQLRQWLEGVAEGDVCAGSRPFQ
jgi:uncharacterized protein YecT (DUF1311 family)